MKKYLMMGAAALTLGAAFTSCSKDKDLFDPSYAKQMIVNNYNEAFVETFGQPASNQDWGFGTPAASRMTRSQSAPACPDITAPYDEAWVATYNETAKEPNSTNATDNYDNSTYATNYGEGGPNSIDWQDSEQVKDRNYFFGDDGNQDSWETRIAWALANHPSWVIYNADETFVRNFKITGTWNGDINVVATEGLTDGVANNNERTVVVTGTWNITANQRVGSKGKIIIANGGTVNVASGVMLNMVNQARLVVLPGGKLTGAGTVEVNNGNATGEENYNAGTIDVAVFNNNFGKFYNYGDFLVTEYRGGAQESNFYNHHLVSIKHTGLGSETPNARIFNGCQWYCEGDMRCRNYEGVNGSSFIVGGQLMVSSSEDGTTTPTYFALAEGAVVKVGSLYNNGTSWSGPTSGYAALEIDNQIDFLNWEQDAPETGGYFENNIYVKAGNWNNIPLGNGYQAGETATADYKFWNIVANCRGNNGVTKVQDSNNVLIDGDEDFELGKAGCTPGFKGTTSVTPPPTYPKLRVIAEDLSATEASDFDFNDVVFDVEYLSPTQVAITLQAAGGTLPLRINRNDSWEVHKLFGDLPTGTIINTYNEDYYKHAPCKHGLAPVELTLNGAFSTDENEFKQQVKAIPVEVQKADANGDLHWYELTAGVGEPACKIGVPVTFQWMGEGQPMTSVQGFSEWVQNPSHKVAW